MTDEPTSDAAILRALLDTTTRPPKDIITRQRSPEEEREWLLDMDRRHASGRLIPGSMTIPGEVVTDVDGAPIAVGPATTEPVYIAPLVISDAVLARAGLTPADVPNLHVIPTTEGSNS